MIQDIAPHVFNNQYTPAPPTAHSTVLCFDKNKLLIQKNADGTFALPTFALFEAQAPDIRQAATYLFSIDSQPFYLLPPATPPPGFI